MQALIDYLKRFKAEEELRSDRELARRLGISPRTLGRLFAGIKIRETTLATIAQGLNLPPEAVYSLAGLISSEDDIKSMLAREIEYLLAKLPPEDQEEIREIARLKAERRRKQVARQQQESETDGE